MRFTNACLSATFFTAGMLLLSKDTHVGSRLSGAATVMGALCFGALIASAMVSDLLVLCEDEQQLKVFLGSVSNSIDQYYSRNIYLPPYAGQPGPCPWNSLHNLPLRLHLPCSAHHGGPPCQGLAGKPVHVQCVVAHCWEAVIALVEDSI